MIAYLTSNLDIYVSNTLSVVNDATTTTSSYLLIATFCKFTVAEYSLRQLNWKPEGISNDAHDPTNKTLAILGLGGIGMCFATLASTLSMHIIYHSRHKNTGTPQCWKYFENVEEMLRQADALSIHILLGPETVGLVSERWIRLLKRGAIIINTACGRIIDETALISALEDGHVCFLVWHWQQLTKP
jgi:lactate dehydrogenase-like 2-hydroxyacid dehydrogenase